MQVFLAILLLVSSNAFAIPQLINYQGQLTSPSGTPLDTTVSMTFTIWPTAVAGAPDWTETHPVVTVTDGLFNVQLGSITTLPDLFSVDRWLGVTVGDDIEMIPRERIVSVAHAYRVGTVDGASGGVITGNVTVDTLITGGVRFDDGSVQTTANFDDFQLDADTNTFDATKSWVQSMGYLRGQDNTASVGAFVGGGDFNSAGDYYSTVSGGYSNNAVGYSSAVSGGRSNTADDTCSVVSGGRFNSARGKYSFVGGGGGASASDSNSAIGDYSVASGGTRNLASGYASTVAGGDRNDATDSSSTVSGGSSNEASGHTSTVAGGAGNEASGTHSSVGGGLYNTASSLRSSVAGGLSNEASGQHSFVGGGYFNNASSNYSTVSGGRFNSARGPFSFVGGGGGEMEADSNSALGDYSVVAGGQRNNAEDNWSTVSGGAYNDATAFNSTVAGGSSNEASNTYSTVSGGYGNDASGYISSVSGGNYNTASGNSCTVSGGSNNEASDNYSTISGGSYNEAAGYHSTVAGGRRNYARGDYSVIIGGGNTFPDSNSASGDHAVILGGAMNRATDDYATCAGYNVDNSGKYSFGFGLHLTMSNCDSSFGFSDGSENAVFYADKTASFLTTGGFRIWTANPMSSDIGTRLTAGGTSWVALCDSTSKENRRDANGSDVLEKISAMPIDRWNYKHQDETIEHIGPMAQDFWNAFHLGSDSLGIETIDADGVLFASVKALNERCNELQRQNDELRKLMQQMIQLGINK